MKGCVGSDSPTGQASMPNAIHRAIVRISSMNEIPAEKVIAMATGNTADLYGLKSGKIEIGREADIIIIDNLLDLKAKMLLRQLNTVIRLDALWLWLTGKLSAYVVKIHDLQPDG